MSTSKIVLLYSGSKHGWMRNDFHSRCDKKGPTVSIVLSSKNKLSCGYTRVSWQSKGNWKDDPTAWLMQLDTLTKYPVHNSKEAVYHYSGCSIWFGYHLLVGYHSEPMNGVNGSCCTV